MSDSSKLNSEFPGSVPANASQLLPLVYDELRRLAAAKMAGQPAGHSLQATALVHEAYMRLVKHEPDRDWESRSHFFTAAAEAMRRILIDRARRKQRIKHGGQMARKRLAEDSIAQPKDTDLPNELLDIDAALEEFQKDEPRVAQLVKLRFFVGLSLADSADVLGVSRATAVRDWTYARAWLIRYMQAGSGEAAEA